MFSRFALTLHTQFTHHADAGSLKQATHQHALLDRRKRNPRIPLAGQSDPHATGYLNAAGDSAALSCHDDSYGGHLPASTASLCACNSTGPFFWYAVGFSSARQPTSLATTGFNIVPRPAMLCWSWSPDGYIHLSSNRRWWRGI